MYTEGPYETWASTLNGYYFMLGGKVPFTAMVSQQAYAHTILRDFLEKHSLHPILTSYAQSLVPINLSFTRVPKVCESG